MTDGWQKILGLAVLCAVLVLATGCAAHQSYPSAIEDEAGIERPAEPLSDEQDLADRIGEVGIVILVVVVTVGGILVPLLLL